MIRSGQRWAMEARVVEVTKLQKLIGRTLLFDGRLSLPRDSNIAPSAAPAIHCCRKMKRLDWFE